MDLRDAHLDPSGSILNLFYDNTARSIRLDAQNQDRWCAPVRDGDTR